jgi:arylsulfatase A-like enzyme
MDIIQKQISPLVWLFGIYFLFSPVLVVYQTWIKEYDDRASYTSSEVPLSDKSRPNIVLVTFDALAARDMSVYGFSKVTTPFISKWAKESSLFLRVEAASNWTAPTTASLMTGKRVWTHQKYHEMGFKPVQGRIENLPLEMKKYGYYTMALVQNYVASVRTLGISHGFDIAPLVTEFLNPPGLFTPGWSFGAANILMYNLFGNKILQYDWIIDYRFILGKLLDSFFISDYSKTPSPPDKVFNRFLEIIDSSPPEPYFAWIHLYPPHHPYLPSDEFKGFFDTTQRMLTFLGQRQGRKEINVYLDQYKHLPEDIDILRARYDEFIRYCDKQFETFISQLIKRNKLGNTVIILSSDHGESFEHNIAGAHDNSLYESETHIPLIIKESAQTEGKIINYLVEQIDIPVTILDLAEIPIPSWMEGHSLVPLMRGEMLLSKPAFSMNFRHNYSRWHKIKSGKIAVWEGDYKLIYYLDTAGTKLYNLMRDPDELNNLVSVKPKITQHMLTLIQDNLENANDRIIKGR